MLFVLWYSFVHACTYWCCILVVTSQANRSPTPKCTFNENLCSWVRITPCRRTVEISISFTISVPWNHGSDTECLCFCFSSLSTQINNLVRSSLWVMALNTYRKQRTQKKCFRGPVNGFPLSELQRNNPRVGFRRLCRHCISPTL